MPRPSCPHCPHCQAIAAAADLRLTVPAPRSVPGGVDRAFYAEFGRVYDLARTRSTQPVKLLRSVNATLTPSRCRDYLRRARALGLVASPGRDPVVPVTTSGGAVEHQQPATVGHRAMSDAEAAAWLASARESAPDLG